MDTVNVKWKDKMSFISEVDDHFLQIDTKPENGGENSGPRPKPLILTALGGCTAMDVVSILKKMRVEYDSFNVKVEGELTEEHPRQYLEITVTYEIYGSNISAESVKRAVSLSEERYCGVSAMLRKALKINSLISINNQLV
jgi:putative redox protein